jgi:hypothetical protein
MDLNHGGGVGLSQAERRKPEPRPPGVTGKWAWILRRPYCLTKQPYFCLCAAAHEFDDLAGLPLSCRYRPDGQWRQFEKTRLPAARQLQLFQRPFGTVGNSTSVPFVTCSAYAHGEHPLSHTENPWVMISEMMPCPSTPNELSPRFLVLRRVGFPRSKITSPGTLARSAPLGTRMKVLRLRVR